jgi:hypothetical protein
MIFEYVCVLFYAIDMKLFLPVKSFQDCMKIQLGLNKLSEWCERNSLFKTIAFSRTHYTLEFFYMLGGTVLDRISSINDLGVNMSLVRPKLKYASCGGAQYITFVWVDKVERVQRRFIRYALRSLVWTEIYDLLPYEHS